MKQLLVYSTLAAFAGSLNAVVAKQEAAWIPGRLEIRGGCIATILEADPSKSPNAPGTYLEYRLLTGEQAEVQAELDKLQAENPYWKAVAHGLDDALEASFVELTATETPAATPATPPAVPAKKAAKKAAKNAAKKASKTASVVMKADGIQPAFKLVVLVALAQP